MTHTPTGSLHETQSFGQSSNKPVEQGPKSTAHSAQNGTGRPPLPLNAQNSPFGLLDVGLQRLNLGEATTELACFPEEDETPLTSNAGPVSRSWGSATYLGSRSTLEDTFLAVPDLSPGGTTVSLFGVFDGHSGVQAAEFARDHLAEVLRSSDKLCTQPGEALNTAFLDLDERFYLLVKDESPLHESGSTLLAALIVGSQLWVANAGDSRAVLSCRGRAEELSEDHRPKSNSEVHRVVALGGVVSDDYLGGHLAVTRSMGDYHLDNLKSKNLEGQYFSGPLTAEPTISCHTLKGEDEFIVMACDGLWDIFTSQRVIEMARQSLQQNVNDPTICANDLVEACKKKHASDNVTVLVICLSDTAPPRRATTDMTRSLSQNGFATLRNAIQNAHVGS